MMFISIMNHQLSAEQVASLDGYDTIIELPPELKSLWGSIPPEADAEGVEAHIRPVLDWLGGLVKDGDTVNVAGEITACLCLIHSIDKHIRLVTATSRRETVETPLPDGGVSKRSIFHHVRWRRIN